MMAMHAMAERLTAGLETAAERMQAIFRFVSQDMRHMGLTLEDDTAVLVYSLITRRIQRYLLDGWD